MKWALLPFLRMWANQAYSACSRHPRNHNGKLGTLYFRLLSRRESHLKLTCNYHTRNKAVNYQDSCSKMPIREQRVENIYCYPENCWSVGGKKKRCSWRAHQERGKWWQLERTPLEGYGTNALMTKFRIDKFHSEIQWERCSFLNKI